MSSSDAQKEQAEVTRHNKTLDYKDGERVSHHSNLGESDVHRKERICDRPRLVASLLLSPVTFAQSTAVPTRDWSVLKTAAP
jgi:hypothetical protein